MMKTKEIEKKTKGVQGEVITFQEACQLLRITPPTLRKWTRAGVFQAYRIGSRVLYKKEEVLSSLPIIPNKKHVNV